MHHHNLGRLPEGRFEQRGFPHVEPFHHSHAGPGSIVRAEERLLAGVALASSVPLSTSPLVVAPMCPPPFIALPTVGGVMVGGLGQQAVAQAAAYGGPQAAADAQIALQIYGPQAAEAVAQGAAIDGKHGADVVLQSEQMSGGLYGAGLQQAQMDRQSGS